MRHPAINYKTLYHEILGFEFSIKVTKDKK
jgi:hypothetical protein